MIHIEPQNSIGFAIRSLSNLLRRKMMETAPPPTHAGMTETGGLIMGYLCDHAGQELYQRDLEEVFFIRRSTASKFLKDLERDGMLLRLSVSHDARLKKLVPTEKALAIHREIIEKTELLEKLIQAGLSPDEIAQFLQTAQKIQKNLSL